MSGWFAKLLLPAEGRVSANDLIILGEAECNCVLVGITSLVELPYAEMVAAGTEDEFKIDFLLEERIENLEVTDNVADGGIQRCFQWF